MHNKLSTTPYACLHCGASHYPRLSHLRHGSGLFCTRLCYAEWFSEQVRSAFWNKVDRSDQCWLWMGAPDHWGYGHTGTKRVHRVAYAEALGRPLARAEHVLHVCDNRLCVRNDEPGTYEVNGIAYQRFGHLFLATQPVNMADMKAKGRGAWQNPEWRPNRRRGEDAPHALLTNAVAAEIKAALAQGASPAALARQYHVAPHVVRNIKYGHTYASVPDSLIS